MSNYAENVDFTEQKKSELEMKKDKLRFIERQFERRLEDWHFAMVGFFDEPIKIFSWFKFAKKVGDRIFFDGSTQNKQGIACFDWVRDHYMMQLREAFGVNIKLVLATDGRIIKQFPEEKRK